MKRLFFIVVLLLLQFQLWAVPAKPGVKRTLVLANGQKVEATLAGDEFMRYWVAADGRFLTVDNVGKAKVLQESELKSLRQSSQSRRTSANTARSLKVSRKSAQGPRRVGDFGDYTGSKKGIVILVNFSDVSFKTDHSTWNGMFNTEGFSEQGHVGSVSEYFSDQSYGKFDLSFDVVGPVTVSKTLNYYGQNSGGSDAHPAEMVIEACKLVDSQVNFSDYDWDGDGYVDQVFVVYAGYGEAQGAPANTIWPHEWNLTSASYNGDGSGSIYTDAVYINTYAVSNELAGTSGTTLNGMGTACHEFSHCLGYPDLYDIDYKGNFGMGYWDVMDKGSYSGPYGYGEVPCGFSAYERMCAGWLNPTEITSGMTVEDMYPLNDSPVAYSITNSGKNDEMFLFEYRNNDKWFKYVGSSSAVGEGMFVTHIDYDSYVWQYNQPNCSHQGVNNHERVSFVPANNNKGEYDGNLYPYGSNNSLSSTTTPALTFYNKTAQGNYTSNLSVNDIAFNEDGTMSFRTNGMAHASGDVNGDGEINTGDYVGIINLILGTSTEGLDREAADVNGDGTVDTGDAVAIINYVLYGNFYGN